MKADSNVFRVTDSCPYYAAVLKLPWLQAIPMSGAATALDFTTRLQATNIDPLQSILQRTFLKQSSMCTTTEWGSLANVPYRCDQVLPCSGVK